ncbi:MAG: hypothetical protein ACYTGV_17210 [Planctomycetota bacterium]
MRRRWEKLDKPRQVLMRVGEKWVKASVLGRRDMGGWHELTVAYRVEQPGLGGVNVNGLVDAGSPDLRQVRGGYPLPKTKAPRADAPADS